MYQIWIALIGSLIMAAGVGGVLYLIISKQAEITAKMIKFLTVACLLPLLLILGITNSLGKDAIGTLVGVIVGYGLAGFGKDTV